MTLTELIQQLPKLNEDFYQINVHPQYTIMPTDDATKMALHKLVHEGIYFRIVDPLTEIPPYIDGWYQASHYFADYSGSILESPLVNKIASEWAHNVFYENIKPSDMNTLVLESHVNPYDMLWIWRKAYRFLEQNPTINLKNIKFPLRNDGNPKKAHPADHLAADFTSQSGAYKPTDRTPKFVPNSKWTAPIYQSVDRCCYQLQARPNYIAIPTFRNEMMQWLYQKGIYFDRIIPELSIPQILDGNITRDEYLDGPAATILRQHPEYKITWEPKDRSQLTVIETDAPIHYIAKMHQACCDNKHIEKFIPTNFDTWYDYNDLEEETFLEDPFFIAKDTMTESTGITELAYVADKLH